MKTMEKEVKLPIADFVAERGAGTDRLATPDATDWNEAEAARFYRPLTRPLTLGADAVDQLRRGDERGR
jgi:hypothetical protein